jgi:hypothetical protein
VNPQSPQLNFVMSVQGSDEGPLTLGIIGLFDNAVLTELVLEHQITGFIRMNELKGSELK